MPQIECEALVALYESANGSGWTSNNGWVETNTPCNWSGVTCEAGRVSKLALAGNQLNGTIPPELSNLTALQELYLSNNRLSGQIPPELGNLTALQIFFFTDNRISGQIPAEVGNLAALQVLSAGANQLSGQIPAELGNLTALRGRHRSTVAR